MITITLGSLERIGLPVGINDPRGSAVPPITKVEWAHTTGAKPTEGEWITEALSILYVSDFHNRRHVILPLIDSVAIGAGVISLWTRITRGAELLVDGPKLITIA